MRLAETLSAFGFLNSADLASLALRLFVGILFVLQMIDATVLSRAKREGSSRGLGNGPRIMAGALAPVLLGGGARPSTPSSASGPNRTRRAADGTH